MNAPAAGPRRSQAVALAAILVLLAGWAAADPPPRGRVYAVLFTASEHRPEAGPAFHPIDRHVGWVHLVRVFHHLQARGARPDDIQVLYDEGRAVTDPLVADREPPVVARLQSGGAATRANLAAALARVVEMAAPDDELVIVLKAHGRRPTGDLHVPHDDAHLRPADLDRMLTGLRARLLVVVDACHSGRFLSRARAPGAWASASGAAAAWHDRDLAFSELMTAALSTPDVDGERVSFRQAFDTARREYRRLGLARRPFMLREYADTVPDPQARRALRDRLRAIDFHAVFRQRGPS